MKRFKSIVVGVDLAEGDIQVADEVNTSTKDTIAQATWLAKTNSAQLTFLHVVSQWANQMDANTQNLLDKHHDKRTVMDHANEVVSDMAQRARNDGIAAQGLVLDGMCWREVIRQVLRKGHDLVIIGNRRQSLAKWVLLGSNGIRLLRKCPCPVWIAMPMPDGHISSVLVAHDLSEVGDLAMELGCTMAMLHGAQLHVLHAAEYPESSSMFPARVSNEKAAKYRQDSLQHIAAQAEGFDLVPSAYVHFVTEPPAVAILDCIEQNSIELLVMGTIVRSGISGLITGNTAERLMTQVPCSILAVKPAGFRTPVTLPNEQESSLNIGVRDGS